MSWGEANVSSLVARFEARCPFATRFHCYRTGLGAEVRGADSGGGA